MNNFGHLKQMRLLLAAALLIGSSSTIDAFSSKKAGLALLLASGGYVFCKSDYAENPITLKTLPDFLKQLADEMAQGNVKESTLLLVKLSDDLLLGHKGKPTPPQVAGTSILFPGEDTVEDTTLDGKEVRLIIRKGLPAYGCVGILCNKLKSLLEYIDLLNKGCEFYDGEKGFSKHFWAAMGE